MIVSKGLHFASVLSLFMGILSGGHAAEAAPDSETARVHAFNLPQSTYLSSESRAALKEHHALWAAAFDGEDLLREVDAFPTQRQKLTAPKPGVHGQQYRRRQVVAEMGQGRKQFLPTILAPSVP